MNLSNYTTAELEAEIDERTFILWGRRARLVIEIGKDDWVEVPRAFAVHNSPIVTVDIRRVLEVIQDYERQGR